MVIVFSVIAAHPQMISQSEKRETRQLASTPILNCSGLPDGWPTEASPASSRNRYSVQNQTRVKTLLQKTAREESASSGKRRVLSLTRGNSKRSFRKLVHAVRVSTFRTFRTELDIRIKSDWSSPKSLVEFTERLYAWVCDNIGPSGHRHAEEGQKDKIDKIPHLAEICKRIARSLRLQVVEAC